MSTQSVQVVGPEQKEDPVLVRHNRREVGVLQGVVGGPDEDR